MADLFVKQPFYYAGALRAVGDPIEPTNAIDRKSLEGRGLIGPADQKQAPEPDNKMQPDPANKSGAPASSGRRS